MVHKQTHIKKAAPGLFANEGYHITTISRIANCAGILKGSVYTCYKSREELLLVKELQNIVQPILKSLTDFFRERGLSEPGIETRLFLSALSGIAVNYQSSLKNFPFNELQDLLIRKYGKIKE